jgi:hypothetical protein
MAHQRPTYVPDALAPQIAASSPRNGSRAAGDKPLPYLS